MTGCRKRWVLASLLALVGCTEGTDGGGGGTSGTFAGMAGAGAVAGTLAGMAAGASAGTTGGVAGMVMEPLAGAAGVSGGVGGGGVGGEGGAAGVAGTAGGAGAAGEAGAGGEAGTAGAAGTGDVPGPSMPPCLTKPSQVIVIGDSYINYNENLNPDIAARAIADGALQAGQEYRMYAVPGSSMASGGIAGFIPDQFALALAQDPDIIASIMTGGGNDILIPNAFLGGAECKERADSPTIAACRNIVQMALDRSEQLMLEYADAGVRDVIYFFYPELPGGGIGGANPNAILGYSYPLAQALCDEAEEKTAGRLRCHFIDLRPVFAGQNWIQVDGVHPTAAGHEAMATAIYGVMKDNCIAQPASSGCCMP